MRGRTTFAVSALVAALAAVPGFAANPLPVAPPPREVRPDGTRDPAPEAAPAEDPAEVVARIIASAKRASDQLAKTDAGAGTRSTQAGILKDIDALLNPPDPPAEGGGGDANDKTNQDKNDDKGGGANDKDKQDKNDGKGNDAKEPAKGGKNGGTPDKQDGMGGTDPKGGMSPGGMSQPKDGQANGGRRPRAGSAPKDGKDPGSTARAGKGNDQPPMSPGAAAAKAGTPNDPPGVAAAGADPKGDRPPPPLQAQLPLADEVAKEVWGHLPERLRQQMSQYYREEFMPRYAGLLKQYYSSLANTPNGPPPAPR